MYKSSLGWLETTMAASPEPLQIEYGAYAPSDGEAMTSLLAHVFSRSDPPAIAAGLTASEFEAFVRLLIPKAAAEELTVVARLAGTGELIGALLTEDSASSLPGGMDRLSPKFDPIFDILGQLDAEYRGGRAARPGDSLHLFLLGVSDRVAGRGVAQQLVAASLQRGRRRGYRIAVTEATNRVSQHIFLRQGFVARVQRSYQAHRFDGRQVFASIAEHGGPILMDKSLAP
jgi:GNAT superfamily N-acetyltransferase